MKKILLLAILLFSGIILSARGLSSIKGHYQGLISGTKFSPLQLSIFSAEKMQLFDENAHTFMSLGLFAVYQQSSVIAFAPLCGVNNYFLQVASLANLEGDNRGIAIAPINAHNENHVLQLALLLNYAERKKYGAQIGIINDTGFIQWGALNYDGRFQIGLRNKGESAFPLGEDEDFDRLYVQFGVFNICDDKMPVIQSGFVNDEGKFQFGLLNVNSRGGFQFGLFNVSDPGSLDYRKTSFQLGLLNYNPKSLIPWLPFVNWNMEQKKLSAENKLIFRQLERNDMEPDIYFDPNQNGDVVCCLDFDKFPQVLDKKSIFEKCSDSELVLLFNAVIDRKPLDFDIIREICKMLPEKGYLVHDKLEKIIFSSKFDYSNYQMLFAYLGCDQKYEAKVIELLDTLPKDFRDGLFIACDRLNTPAITRKLFEKFTGEITGNDCFGAGTGEDAILMDFIKKWNNALPAEDLQPEFQRFKSFVEKNWAPMIYQKSKTKDKQEVK